MEDCQPTHPDLVSRRRWLVTLEPVQRERDGADELDEVVHQRLGVGRRRGGLATGRHQQEAAPPVPQLRAQLEIGTACQPSQKGSDRMPGAGY